MAFQLVVLLSLVLFPVISKALPSYTDSYSPPVTSSTPGVLTNNDFSRGGNGGGPSECDGDYHSNEESIVALSTGWYNGGSLCGHTIRVAASNGRTATATVVDECDVPKGCRNNIVDASNAVWHALGLEIKVGELDITWSVA